MKMIHPIAGTVALLTILTFWITTVDQLNSQGRTDAIVAVKTAIPWGFLLLIPALAATGGTGFRLAGSRSKATTGPLAAKRRRMPVIALNGIFVLVPSALFLAWAAEARAFDLTFYAVQAAELAAGGLNIVLLGLNMRDGLRMTGRLSPAQPLRSAPR